MNCITVVYKYFKNICGICFIIASPEVMVITTKAMMCSSGDDMDNGWVLLGHY